MVSVGTTRYHPLLDRHRCNLAVYNYVRILYICSMIPEFKKVVIFSRLDAVASSVSVGIARDIWNHSDMVMWGTSLIFGFLALNVRPNAQGWSHDPHITKTRRVHQQGTWNIAPTKSKVIFV